MQQVLSLLREGSAEGNQVCMILHNGITQLAAGIIVSGTCGSNYNPEARERHPAPNPKTNEQPDANVVEVEQLDVSHCH